ARGAYINDMNREATDAKKRAFKAMYPKSQTLNKTTVAKYWMTWGRLPHIVSLGAEKNFSKFMDLHARASPQAPDEVYFKRLVAKAILFRECDRIVARQEYGGYKANVVAYTVAWLSYLTGQRVDMDSIWEKQAPSEAVTRTLLELSQTVWDHLNHPPANARNLSEWAKREACWTALREQSHPLPYLEGELIKVGREGTGSAGHASVSSSLAPEAQDDTLLVESKTPEWWFGMARWAAKTDSLQKWERSLAFSLGRILRSGRRPSPKQARQGARILREATDAGYSQAADDSAVQPSSAEPSSK
ncbi:MAG: AIPR family protein, partial [Nitrososphaerales archaeon]